MKIVVTGAMGNIGSNVVLALVAMGHEVRGFGQPTRENRRKARHMPKSVEMMWGDVRQSADVQRAVAGQEVVIHLAYIIPPTVDENPGLAEAVNVTGTRNVIAACQQATPQPKLLFASSLDVFGPTTDQPPPRHVSDPLVETDAYSRHKILGEAMVRESGLTWAIFRFADVPPMTSRSAHPIMYRIPLNTRIEAMHPEDAGLAVARAVSGEDVWGKIWLVGGGAACQLTYEDYLGKMLEAMGIGRLPAEAFGHEPYCTDWLDSSASQELWQYQRHTFDQIVQDFTHAMGPTRYFVPLVRPLARSFVLRLSPFWKEQRRRS
jgi:nucleoside-diphosphate-sugar epimerase